MVDTGLRNADGVTVHIFVYSRLEGERRLLDVLKELEDGEVRKRVHEAMKRGGDIVAEEARMRAPVGTRPPRKGVGTGRLKRSIVVKKVRSRKYTDVLVEADYPENAGKRKNKTEKQAAGSKEYYAFAVEYGTHKMAAQPFLHPALEAKAQRVQEIIAEELDKLCEEATARINK